MTGNDSQKGKLFGRIKKALGLSKDANTNSIDDKTIADGNTAKEIVPYDGKITSAKDLVSYLGGDINESDLEGLSGAAQVAIVYQTSNQLRLVCSEYLKQGEDLVDNAYGHFAAGVIDVVQGHLEKQKEVATRIKEGQEDIPIEELNQITLNIARYDSTLSELVDAKVLLNSDDNDGAKEKLTGVLERMADGGFGGNFTYNNQLEGGSDFSKSLASIDSAEGLTEGDLLLKGHDAIGYAQQALVESGSFHKQIAHTATGNYVAEATDDQMAMYAKARESILAGKPLSESLEHTVGAAARSFEAQNCVNTLDKYNKGASPEEIQSSMPEDVSAIYVEKSDVKLIEE